MESPPTSPTLDASTTEDDISTENYGTDCDDNGFGDAALRDADYVSESSIDDDFFASKAQMKSKFKYKNSTLTSSLPELANHTPTDGGIKQIRNSALAPSPTVHSAKKRIKRTSQIRRAIQNTAGNGQTNLMRYLRPVSKEVYNEQTRQMDKKMAEYWAGHDYYVAQVRREREERRRALDSERQRRHRDKLRQEKEMSKLSKPCSEPRKRQVCARKLVKG